MCDKYGYKKYGQTFAILGEKELILPEVLGKI